MDEPDEIKIEPEVNVEDEVGDPEADEGKAENKIAKMREELNNCRKEKQEYMDGWQRAKADYVNLLKRIEGDAKASELRGKIRAVETLLPAFDALERAKEHGDVPEGFLAIARQLEASFKAVGLEPIGEIGERFDPAVYEAFAQDIAETIETDNTITAVLERGWRVNGFVIRPAKVKVAYFPHESNKPDEGRAPGR
jgi:molecular chaperone GrpE